jgi:DNA-binding IclR family transcriptional regulator
MSASGDTSSPARAGDKLQTLDRGLSVLTELSAVTEGLTVTQLAERLGVHRTIASRLASTLAGHHLVMRGADGKYRLGLRLVELAGHVLPQLSDVALPVLRRLAEARNMTSFLSVADQDECVALVVVEPRHTDVHVGYRTGSRHPIARGAPGIAILAGQPGAEGEDPAVTEARSLGYALTRGHLQQGAVGVAAPVYDEVLRASVGVVAFEEPTVDAAVPDVLAATEEIAELLRRVRH